MANQSNNSIINTRAARLARKEKAVKAAGFTLQSEHRLQWVRKTEPWRSQEEQPHDADQAAHPLIGVPIFGRPQSLICLQNNLDTIPINFCVSLDTRKLLPVHTSAFLKAISKSSTEHLLVVRCFGKLRSLHGQG